MIYGIEWYSNVFLCCQMGVLLYGSHLVAGLGLAVLGSTCPSSRASVTNLSAAPPSPHEHMRGPTGLTNLSTLSCMCHASKPPPRWPMSSDVPTSPDLAGGRHTTWVVALLCLGAVANTWNTEFQKSTKTHYMGDLHRTSDRARSSGIAPRCYNRHLR